MEKKIRKVIGIVLVVYALSMYVLTWYEVVGGILFAPLINFVFLIAGLALIFKKPKKNERKSDG